MIRKLKEKKWLRVLCVLDAVLILLSAVCCSVMGWMAGQLPALDAARRWRGENEMRFTQVACFLPITGTKTEEDIWSFRRTLDQRLVEAAVTAPKEGALWQDAWSAPGKLSVHTDHGSAEASVLGVGGDFFLFHPMQLRSGSFLKESDLMQDRVVLDEELAWILFGSPNVAGLEVRIADKPFYVAGVIRRDEDFASRSAYRDGPGLFMSYSAMHALVDQGITCYEIVVPDLITGFGMHLVQENFPVGDGTLVENTGRFRPSRLLQVAGDYGVRSMGLNGVVCPYWENAVRMMEDYLAALLVLTMALSLLPFATAVTAAVLALWKLGRYAKQKLPQAAEALVEQRKEQRYAERQNNEHANVQ